MVTNALITVIYLNDAVRLCPFVIFVMLRSRRGHRPAGAVSAAYLWQNQRSISNSEEGIDEKIDEIDTPGNGTFLFDLIWKVNSHTIGFGTPEAIRWSLS